jgi:hypothetical protein
MGAFSVVTSCPRQTQLQGRARCVLFQSFDAAETRDRRNTNCPTKARGIFLKIDAAAAQKAQC